MATNASASPAIRETRRDPASPAFEDDAFIDDLTDDDESAGRKRIRCPRCGWTPGPWNRWMCLCGCSWNTFETRGRCPDCGRQWQVTQCLVCGEWSPHEDWYVEEEEP